jgi:hypothetical protein
MDAGQISLLLFVFAVGATADEKLCFASIK